MRLPLKSGLRHSKTQKSSLPIIHHQNGIDITNVKFGRDDSVGGKFNEAAISRNISSNTDTKVNYN